MRPGQNLSDSLQVRPQDHAILFHCVVQELEGEPIGSWTSQVALHQRKDLAPLEELCYSRDPCEVVRLNWKGTERYDSVVLKKNGMLLAELSPEVLEFTDEASEEETLYCVEGKAGSEVSPSSCVLFGAHFCRPGAPFIRGDPNEDGEVDLADAVAVLSYLFRFDTVFNCLDAADSNDDGFIDIGDAILILAFLFTEGEPPLPPFPSCGFDQTESLGCGGYAPCTLSAEPTDKPRKIRKANDHGSGYKDRSP